MTSLPSPQLELPWCRRESVRSNSAGQSQQENFVLQNPGAPPSDVKISPILATAGGIPIINFGKPFTLTFTGCAGGSATYEINPFLGFLAGGATTGSMTETPPGSGTYIATVKPSVLWFGPAEVSISLTCPGGKLEAAAFTVYIDPAETWLMSPAIRSPGRL